MRFRDGPLLLPAFALLLGVWWIVLLAWGTDALPTALLGGAAGACLLCGLALAVWGRVRPPAGRQAEPDLSLGAPATGAGVAAMVLGAQAGTWLVLVGGGMVVLGAALLVREWRAGRRAMGEGDRR
jgi:hypothetical protein